MSRGRLLVILSAVFCAAALAACASRYDVRAGTLPGMDLADYRTFTLEASKAAPAVRESLRAELERLGYVHEERDPDLRVALSFDVAELSRAAPSATGSRMGATKVRRGQLAVSIKDARTGAAVWSGTAAGSLDAESLAEPDTAGDVARRLFAEVAPLPGGAALEGSPAP